MTVITIICASIIVEGVVTYIKMFFKDGKVQWQMLLTIALGITVTVSYNLDIFSLLEMSSRIPMLGCVLTGILVSRGSNYMFDLVKLITELVTKLKA